MHHEKYSATDAPRVSKIYPIMLCGHTWEARQDVNYSLIIKLIIKGTLAQLQTTTECNTFNNCLKKIKLPALMSIWSS